MAIKVNGTTITDVKVNGISVKTVKVGSTTVFQAMAKKWIQTSDTNYTTELELYSSYDPNYQGCATPSHLLSELNSRRPATSEVVGTIIRVRSSLDLSVIGGGIAWCPTYMYYEAVIKEKKWVYLYYTTSQGGYTPFYHDTSSSEQPTVELMEQKFPAKNYNVGHLGEIQWWDNFYVFQVQEV